MRPLIKDECGVDAGETRYVIVGCEDVPGFEAVALGQKVDVKRVTPGIVDKVRQVVKQHPGLRAICLECTELPPYADSIRAATGLPVYDAITCCELFVSGLQDNPYFGLDGWQMEWDGVPKEYQFGQHLSKKDIAKLVYIPGAKLENRPGLPTLSKSANQQSAQQQELPTLGISASQQSARHGGNLCHGMHRVASLGVIRLDYDYPAAKGDIAHPGSHGYPVIYRVVPGLTFEMAQTGFLTEDVQKRFVEAIRFLEAQGVCAITGDCGFMMYFQKLARRNTKLPVFMSSLAHLPAVTCGFAKNELIAILTVNGKSLQPMRPLIKDECGVDAGETRYVIVGCEDVPGFEAVALGQKVDVKKVTPGIIQKVQQVMKKHPQIRAFCLECTELPPYADSIRFATGLPVYDAITNCAFFMSGHKDNPRFGLNNWRASWDGKPIDYKFGANLTAEDKMKLRNSMPAPQSKLETASKVAANSLMTLHLL